MQIGILSDTHSRYATVEKALQLLQDRNINVVLHCGDIEDSETVWLFQGFTAHFVFGNCDRMEAHAIRQAVHGIGETLHDGYGAVELEGVKIAFTHGDDGRLLRDLEASGAFDFIFYGHTHKAEEHRSGPTRVINPGALHRANPKTFVVLDLATRDVQSVVVET
jgi:putative phosphoesterase